MICDLCGQDADDGRSKGDFDGSTWLCSACVELEARTVRIEQRRPKYSDRPAPTTLQVLFPEGDT